MKVVPEVCEREQSLLDRICVVLVRARNPANIGAVARAMHDFGFRHLRVVNEFTPPFEAARSAVDASAVLAAAQSCATVAEAVADCTLVIGTTAVGERDLQHPLRTLPDAADAIRQHAAGTNGRIALLFGSEKTGLSNDELSHCHWLLTIPMYEHEGLRHPSMNLGQAVAVCLWELVRSDARSPVQGIPEPATAAEQERLAAVLDEMAGLTGYRTHHPANSGPAQLRRLVTRLSVPRTDVAVWLGLLRQVVWFARRQPKPELDS
ncbi:MAG: RNA methyltransferase [Acidobacteriota bacterium]|nr:RNA methyltransferase [Acidobacteriota bacterium]